MAKLRKREKERIEIGELFLPKNYSTFNIEQKNALCNKIIESLFIVVDKSIEPEFSRFDVLDQLLESSIITNQEDENYEVCQILQDVRTLLHTDE